MCLVLGVCVCWTVSTSTWALLHSARISGVSRCVCVFLFLAYINLNQSAVSHLCEAAPGPLDGDLALVVDGGPDVDGLAGHVAAAVQAHAARDRARGQARHAQLVLDLAVERLLKNI